MPNQLTVTLQKPVPLPQLAAGLLKHPLPETVVGTLTLATSLEEMAAINANKNHAAAHMVATSGDSTFSFFKNDFSKI